MNANSISVHNLRKKFPGFLLDDISFQVPCGRIVGFIGENGAGKAQRSSSFSINCGATAAVLKYWGKIISNTFNMEASVLYLMNANSMAY